MAEDTAQTYKKQRRRKLFVVVGVVLLLVLAVGAGAGVRWWQAERDSDDDITLAPPLPEQVSDLQELRAGGDTEAFDERIRAALEDPSTDSGTRYWLYVEQGHAFFDRGDWQAAINAYKAAEDIDATYDIATQLAATHVEAGNVDEAIVYYERAIERNPDDNPMREADNDVIRQIIRELEEDRQ